MINRIENKEMHDFLVMEARLENVTIEQNTIKVVYILDGDSVVFSIRYDSINLSELNQSSPESIELFGVTFAVLACLRFGAVLPSSLDFSKYSRYIDYPLLDFLNVAIPNKWSEHRYQIGQMGYKKPKLIVNDNELGQEANYPIFSISKTEEETNKVLLASGSGKDSLLCSLILEAADIEYELVTCFFDIYGNHQQQKALFSNVTQNLKYKHQHNLYFYDEYYSWLKKRIENTNLMERLNKYFPPKFFRTECGEMTILIMSILPIQIFFNIPMLVLGNEKSADAPNLIEPQSGERVSHQWIKSLSAEKEINKLMSKIFTEVRTVSLTKPLHDLKVFKTLFCLNDKLPYATNSCHIQKPWCGKCEKCCYVYAGFCTYGDYDKTVAAFGKDLFAMEENLPVWEELLGLKGYIPWECVGQPEETQFYLYQQYQKGVKNLAIDLFEQKFLLPLQQKGEDEKIYFQAIEERFLQVYESHHTMPNWLWQKVKPFINLESSKV